MLNAQSDDSRKKRKSAFVIGLLVLVNFIVVWMVLAWRL